MSKLIVNQYTASIVLPALFFSLLLIVYPCPADSYVELAVSGPLSHTHRAGSYSNSVSLYPFLNINLFGTFDPLDASSGIGTGNTQRYVAAGVDPVSGNQQWMIDPEQRAHDQ